MDGLLLWIEMDAAGPSRSVVTFLGAQRCRRARREESGCGQVC